MVVLELIEYAAGSLPPPLTPRSATVASAFARGNFRYAEYHEFSASSPSPFPLSPKNISESSPFPAVQLVKYPFGFTRSKVVDPTSKNGVKILLNETFYVSSSSSTHQCFYLSPEAFHALWRDPQFCLLVVRQTVAEELPLPRSGSFALSHVDFEFQPLR